MDNADKNGFDGILSHQEIKELRLYGFFLFLLWPVIVILASLSFLYTFTKDIVIKSTRKNYKFYLFLFNLPYHLLKFALKERNIRILLGMLLLLPLMLTTILSTPLIFFSKTSGVVYEAPQPPSFYYLFGITGKGLLGTTGEGFGIGRLIIIGAWHTYFTSLVATCVVLSLGLLLGVLTFAKRNDALIMFCVEIIESIPIIFFLLVILAILSWWEDTWKNFVLSFPNLISFVKDIIIGVGIGFGFLPRMVRLIREKIKTFVSENFIDGAKAHGIKKDRILWFHIVRKNCLSSIVVTITQIWAAVILIEISLDYLVSISSLLGAKIYASWAQMLLTQEAKEAIIFFKNWWLYVFPGFFIISTVIGFYLFGESLTDYYEQRFIKPEEGGSVTFDVFLKDVCTRIGLIENA